MKQITTSYSTKNLFQWILFCQRFHDCLCRLVQRALRILSGRGRRNRHPQWRRSRLYAVPPGQGGIRQRNSFSASRSRNQPRLPCPAGRVGGDQRHRRHQRWAGVPDVRPREYDPRSNLQQDVRRLRRRHTVPAGLAGLPDARLLDTRPSRKRWPESGYFYKLIKRGKYGLPWHLCIVCKYLAGEKKLLVYGRLDFTHGGKRKKLHDSACRESFIWWISMGSSAWPGNHQWVFFKKTKMPPVMPT